MHRPKKKSILVQSSKWWPRPKHFHVNLLGLDACHWSGPPGSNCWASVASAFHCLVLLLSTHLVSSQYWILICTFADLMHWWVESFTRTEQLLMYVCELQQNLGRGLWPRQTRLSPPPSSTPTPVIYYWPFQGGVPSAVYSIFIACPFPVRLWWFQPRHDKTNKANVRPAKTQISLGIHPAWSESLLSARRKLWFLPTHWAHSEDSGQTGWMPKLIWVFAGRTLTLLVLSCRSSFVDLV